MKNGLSIAFCFCILSFLAPRAYAQYVYSDSLISASLDFHNPDSVVDEDRTNYAYVSNLVSLITTSYLHVHFSQPGKAGDALHFSVQATGQTLGLGLLNGITVKFYDDQGVLVDTRSGASVLQLSLLSPGTGIYGVRTISDISKNYSFHSVRVEFHNLLSVNLLNEFRVFNIYYQSACPPLYATGVHDYKTASLLSPSRVDNPQRAVDANPNNYATMEVPLNLLGIFPPSFLDLSFTDLGRGGDYVGITVGQASGLLSAALLQNIEFSIYDDQGNLRQTKSGFNLLDLKLLAGTSNRYTLGFITNPGNYRIARVRVTLKGLVSLLVNMNVYNAFHYAIDRPPVTISLSGPDTFCQGGSVTLTAFDSLGATRFFWSTGDTTASITVTQSGVYSVQVVDTLSCTRYSVPVRITVVPLPKPQIVGDTVVCAGTVGVLRTSQPYAQYLWSDNSSADTFVVTNSGKYFVRVEDSLGCAGTDTVVVEKNSLIITPTITATDCPENANGVISLNVNGGSGRYAFTWSNGMTGNQITSLSPGLYSVEVVDTVHGCTYNRSYSLSSETNLALKNSLSHTSSCGAKDGRIQVSVVGGSGNYAYAWGHGPTTSTLDSLEAGIYTLRVTDLTAGCQIQDTLVIHDGGSGLVIGGTPSPSTSCSSPNGSITLSASGGTAPYTYTWADGATGASRSGLAVGTYYVLVTDQAGCHQTREIKIEQSASLSITETLTRPGCQGSNGQITLAVSGGSGNYSYLWSNGKTSRDLEGLMAGIYSVTVTDNTSGCSNSETYALGEVSGPTATATVNQPACGNNSNGSIQLNPAAATYRYVWSNGSVARDQMGLKPGDYSVRITDTLSGCTQVYHYELKSRPQIDLAATKKSNTSCLSSPNGEIALEVKSGTAPFSYSWSNGASTRDISGLGAGTYSVVVSDAQGCTANLSLSLSTDSSRLLALSLGAITEASCNTAANGSVAVTVSGGSTPYTYSWSNGATTKDLLHVVPGTYMLTVTDALGCSRSISATIGVSSSNPILISLDSTRAAGCSASSTGAAFISVSGGQSPYTYDWSNGAKTQDITAVAAGSYTVVAKDANGCTDTLSVTVPVDPSGGFSVALDSVVDASCALSGDGAVYIHPTGGSAPYTYQWNTGATTQNLTGVNPGTYTVTVTDQHGCPGQVSATVGMASGGGITISLDSLVPAGCASSARSGIYLSVSGGTAPYTYSWSNGANTQDLTGVVPGTYTVTVTDALGCSESRQETTLVDSSYTVRAVVDSIVGAGCVGGKSGAIYVSVTRGIAPYTFSWSNGASTEDLLDVGPGTYSLMTIDAGGCTHELEATVMVDTNNSIRIVLDSMTGPGCPLGRSGALYVSVSGGVAPYTYSWSTGATSQDLTGVGAGTHTLMVYDAAGCSRSFTQTLAVDTSNLVKVSSSTVDPAGCMGSASGSISITVEGGTSPYRYAWSNGDTTQNIKDLSPGSYSLIITDASGCSNDFHATVGVDTTGGIRIIADQIVDAVCEGSLTGSITLSVSGGTPPYHYLWSNGALSKDLSFVAPGIYEVRVTDAKGCSATLSATVGVHNIDPLVITVDSLFGVGCMDSLSGEIYVSVSGGKAPYNFLWSNGATTPYLKNIGIGNYSLKVNDEQGCSESLTTYMDYADSMTLSAHLYPVSCFGQEDGSIKLIVQNGRGTYAYSWSHGADLDSISGLSPGRYSVQVTDLITGCEAQSEFELDAPSQLSVEARITDDSCGISPLGAISLEVSGGTPPYTYLWADGSLEEQRTGLTEGLYGLEIKDAHDCFARLDMKVGKILCDFRIRIFDALTPNGDGANDTWIIEGLALYPNHTIQVFNKWGDLVFETRDYKNDWAGTRTNGEPLADGTYFYLIRLHEENRSGGPSDFTGSLLIQR